MEMGKKSCGDDEDLSLHLLHKQGGCLIQILVLLPVVSLLRFKSVCKSWCDLIQSPFFIDLHTTAISSSSKFGSFIVHVNRFIPSEKASLLMLSTPSDYSSESEEEEEEESVSISGGGGGGGGSNDDDHEEEEGLVVVVDNLGFEMHNKEIVGSCNGLVCIRDRQMSRDSRSESKPIKVSLWNPATGKGVDLPESIPIPGGVFSLFVFGFDVETKDYKVVQFTGLKPRWNGNGPQFCFCRVQVYTLSSNSWRLLEGIPCLPGYPFRYPQSVVYLNNATTSTCFFLAHFFYTRSHPCLHRNDRLIISFDFTKEILTPIQLPDHHREQDLCLCSLGHDKIALFTSTDPYEVVGIRRCQDFNIWVLNYEQVSSSSSSVNKESWKELHSFQLQLESPNKCYYAPRGISNDGKFALLISEYGDKMNLYNFATKKVKRPFLSCGKVMSKSYAYELSLVSVIGGNGAREQQQQAAAADLVIENSATNL